MSDETKQTARRVVDRLLGEEYSSSEEFEQRPGGSKDPYRQTTVKMAFKKGSFSGKRGTKPVASSPGGVKKKKKKGEAEAPKGRFDLSFGECRSAAGNAGKAWKKGKKTTGQAVAGKPGKVSYKEALMRSVLERIAVKKAMKQGKKMAGKQVAGKPGKVSYREAQEDATTWEDFWRRARIDAFSGSDREYLDTLKYYLQLDPNPVTNIPDNFVGWLRTISNEEWMRMGERNPLRRQWLDAQRDVTDMPDTAPAARQTAGSRGRHPLQPHGVLPSVESRRESIDAQIDAMLEGRGGGMKGIKARKKLSTIAKRPGSVRFGKK